MNIFVDSQAMRQRGRDSGHTEVVHELFGDPALIKAVFDVCLPHEQCTTTLLISVLAALQIPGPNMLEWAGGTHITAWRSFEELI